MAEAKVEVKTQEIKGQGRGHKYLLFGALTSASKKTETKIAKKPGAAEAEEQLEQQGFTQGKR